MSEAMDTIIENRNDLVGRLVVRCPHCYIDTRVNDDGTVDETPRICDKAFTVSQAQRRDMRFPGAWCDGAYGDRHPITLCLGPEGKAYA